VKQAMTLDSRYTKDALQGLHPNFVGKSYTKFGWEIETVLTIFFFFFDSA
jgi:hypothetical protein